MNRVVTILLVVALAGMIGWSVGSWARGPDRAPPTTGVPVDEPSDGPSDGPAAVDRQAARVARLSEQYACTPEGLAPGVLPQHSLVRLPGTNGADGIRVVSFDRGWEMHTGDRPGTLLAVCEL